MPTDNEKDNGEVSEDTKILLYKRMKAAVRDWLKVVLPDGIDLEEATDLAVMSVEDEALGGQ